MLSRGVVPLGSRCGGAELVAYQLARHLVSDGHEVTLVSDVDETFSGRMKGLEFAPVDNRLQRVSRWLPAGFVAWIIRHLASNIAVTALARKLIREERFEIVHAHGNLSALLLSFFAKVPVAYTEHDAPPWCCRYRRWWERIIRTAIYRVVNVSAWRRVDRISVTFPSLRDELIERWGVPADNVFAIGSGVDADVFHPVKVTREPRFRRYCLFVGGLTARKAPDLLLRALARVPEVCCVFVGDGPMRSQLEGLARQLGLGNRVAFLGSIDSGQLPPIYSEADLVVLPSFSETSPLVAAEAMACGTPVLATRIAGLPALVDDFDTGLLVSPGDVGELSMAIRFLSRDPELLSSMGRQAQARAGRRWGWPVLTTQYEDVYRSTERDADAPAMAAMG